MSASVVSDVTGADGRCPLGRVGLSEERPVDASEYAQTVRLQVQELRRQTHAQLMESFLPAEVFEPPDRPALRAV